MPWDTEVGEGVVFFVLILERCKLPYTFYVGMLLSLLEVYSMLILFVLNIHSYIVLGFAFAGCNMH